MGSTLETEGGGAGNRRPILTVVFRPGCSGCALLERRTLRDERVIREIDGNWNLTVKMDEMPSDVIWYPTMITLTADHKPLMREEGFLPPYEFIPFLRLARVFGGLRAGDYEQAVETLAATCQEFPQSGWIPECLYYQGVASHLAGRPRDVAKIWRDLRDSYPRSVWAHKASLSWEPEADLR